MKTPFAQLAEGRRLGNWLPESDAVQNGDELLYEFSFGILNGRAGHKRILLEDECQRLCQARVRPSRKSIIQAAHDRAVEIKQRLESMPGLTRSAIAGELGVNRARVTQILGRFKKAPAQRARPRITPV